jgi:hypothetical protein
VGQSERRPPRQSGAFAKIAFKAIFIHSALPLGENERGFKIKKAEIITITEIVKYTLAGLSAGKTT